MSRRTETDREVMARVQADDGAAFAELYDRFAGQALGVARGVCRDGTLAADSVQEAFLSIWRFRARYRAEFEVRPWVLGIVRNRAIDVVRRDVRHRQQIDLGGVPELPDATDTAAEVALRDARERMRSHLANLPTAQREVVVLAYFGGLTQTEIARQLQIPVGTVKGRLRLGLIKLRATCDDLWTDEEHAA